MITGYEQQIVEGLAGLALAGVTAGISYLSSHVKAWFVSHTTANVAAAGNTVVDTLDNIAENVFHDFHDRILADAKSNGVLTPALIAQVKADAVRSVLDQAGSVVGLGAQLVGDVPALVAGIIAKKFTVNGITPSVPPAVPATLTN